MFGSAENRELAREKLRLESAVPRARPLLAAPSMLDLAEAMGRKFTPRYGDPTPVVYEHLSRASKRILISNQVLEPEFFEDPLFIGTMRSKVDRGLDLEIAFNKEGATSSEEVTKRLNLEHPQLMKLAHSFPDRVKLFWARYSIELQFLVVDDKSTMFAEPISTPNELQNRQLERKNANLWGKLRFWWKDGWAPGYVSDPLTDYATVPFTDSSFNDRGSAQILENAFVIIRDRGRQITA